MNHLLIGSFLRELRIRKPKQKLAL